jgi:exopolysaccharide production protein ExoQ
LVRFSRVLDGFTARASQLIVAVIILAPPLAVFLAGRDLFGEAFYNADPPTAPFPVMTLATAIVGLSSCWIILRNLRDQPVTGEAPLVLLGFLIFFATNVILCVPFGQSAYISRSNIYPLVLFLAIYLSRDEGAAKMIDAAKQCLLIMMAASLVGGLLYPEVTRRVWAPEIRLPYIDFRFWGFGEHANSIAPMALLLAMLTLHRPFRRRWLTALSYLCSGLVILLAQSQTVWFIAAIMFPLSITYQSPTRWASVVRAIRSPRVWGSLVLVSLGVAVILLVVEMAGTELAGRIDAEDSPLLTGRPDVWRIAMDVFESHPIFGYGLLAWEQEFRDFHGIPWALHAHNQLLQSLSVGGLVGAAGLIAYTLVLGRGTLLRTRATQGLALALLFIILVRMLTEVPLNLGAILLGDTVVHLLLFRLLTAPAVDHGNVEVARAVPQLVESPERR